MKKIKSIITKNATELAEVLGLEPVDGLEIEIRSDLNDKIIQFRLNAPVLVPSDQKRAVCPLFD